jgi:hypothetical protein
MWMERVKKVLHCFPVEDKLSIRQVAGIYVYAALSTLSNWNDPKPGYIQVMIATLDKMADILLPEIVQEERNKNNYDVRAE